MFLGNVAVDVPLSDTYFVVAHFHMVMGIAPVLVILGAIYHWFPLITGRFLNERLGKEATDKGHNVEFISKNGVPEGVDKFKSKVNNNLYQPYFAKLKIDQ